jgi:hypothetical protein
MQTHKQMHLRSLNLALIRQTSKGDKWEGMCSAQRSSRMINKPRDVPKSRPTSIYRRTPSNRAVRQLILLQSRWTDALVKLTRRAGRTLPTRVARPDALLDEPDATVPASGLSLVSTHHDRTRPVDHDRTRHDVRLEDRDARKHWALTRRVRSNRDRVRFSVRSPLWPPFDSPFHIWARLSMCVTLARVLARETVTLRCYASICVAIMSTTCHGIHNHMCLGCTFNKIKVWKLVLHNMLW